MQRSIVLFENSIRSDQTKRVYSYYLQKFLIFTELKDFDSILALPKEQLQMLVEDYLFYLKKRISPNSLQPIFSAIDLFLTINEKEYNFKKIKKMMPSKIKRSGSQAWSHKDITSFLRQARKSRAKALILFLASTGARIGTISDLRIRHLSDMQDNCKSVLFYEGTNEEYTGFLTPEASQALDDYLNERKRDGESMTGESPVFRTEYQLGIEKVIPLASKSAQSVISRLIQAAKIPREKSGNRYSVQLDHGFRKFYNTVLKTNDSANLSLAEKLMGHAGVFALDGNYLNPSKDKLFLEFKKHILNLTIDSSERDKLKIAELEKEKSEIKNSQVKELAQLLDENPKLLEDAEKLGELLDKTVFKYFRQSTGSDPVLNDPELAKLKVKIRV